MAPTLTEQILDRAPDAVVSMDQGGRVTYWNPRAEEVFGVRCEDALGRTVAELIVPERHRAAHIAGIERFLADGTGPLLQRRLEIEGVEPHVEDTWLGHRVAIGDAVIVPLGDVGRCVVTTCDPDTAVSDLDTLKLLAGYRREGVVEPLPHGQVKFPRSGLWWFL